MDYYDDDYNGKNEEEDYADEDEIVRQLNYLDIDPYEQDLAENLDRLRIYSPTYSTAMDCNTRSPPRRINQYRLPPSMERQLRLAQNQQPPPSSTRTNYRSQEPENVQYFYELEQRRRGPVMRMEEVYNPELIDFTWHRQRYLPIVNDIINRYRTVDIRTHIKYTQDEHRQFIREFNPLIIRQSNISDGLKFGIEELYQRLLEKMSTAYGHVYNITKDEDYLFFCEALKKHIL